VSVLDLVNRTPLAAALLVTDPLDGGPRLGILVAKATFTIGADQQLELDTEAPLPVLADDEETDLGLIPRDDLPREDEAFEVILLGKAHTPGGRNALRMAVKLQVGEVRRELAVFGDRVWQGQGLVELLAAKSAALTEQTRQRSGGVVEFGASDAGNFWLLNTVNTYLPLLSHLQQCPEEHPVTVYRSLSMLTGALTTFSTEQEARDLPAYDHQSPGPLFRDLERRIRALLETVTPTRYRTVVLTPKTESMLAADLTDPRLVEGRPQFYLAVSGDLDEHSIRDDVPGQVIVGSPHNIDFLVQTATPGVALVHVPMPPRDFPLKAGRTYFRLETSGETWPTVLEARAIAIYVGGARLRTCRFELVATQA